MRINADAIAHSTAQEFVGRHTVVFSSDVPQRLIYTGQGGHQNISTAEKGRAVDMLPVVFNTERVFADKIIGKFFDSRPGTLGLTFKRGFSPSDDTGIRCNLHETHPATWVELFNLSNFHLFNYGLLDCSPLHYEQVSG